MDDDILGWIGTVIVSLVFGAMLGYGCSSCSSGYAPTYLPADVIHAEVRDGQNRLTLRDAAGEVHTLTDAPMFVAQGQRVTVLLSRGTATGLRLMDAPK